MALTPSCWQGVREGKGWSSSPTDFETATTVSTPIQARLLLSFIQDVEFRSTSSAAK
jgi:hypothetical protein